MIDYLDKLRFEYRDMTRYRRWINSLEPTSELVIDVNDALIQIQDEIKESSGRYYYPSEFELMENKGLIYLSQRENAAYANGFDEGVNSCRDEIDIDYEE